MKKDPVRVRASSISAMTDCPARWVAIHIEGRSTPSSAAAAIGSAIHHGTAVYDVDRVHGRMPSLSAAMDAAHQSAMHPDYEIDWARDNREDGAKIATSLTERYAKLESDKHDYVAVEAHVDALHLTDLNIVLTGTTDRVYRNELDELGIADIKSGKTAVSADGVCKTHGHGWQCGVYEIVAEAAIGKKLTARSQIIGMQTNKTPDKQRIATGEIADARLPLLGDADHPGVLSVVAGIANGDLPAYGNPRSMMCSPRYCPAFNSCFWRK